MTIIYIFISVLIVSSVSLLGVMLLSINKKLLQRMLAFLVSFATGAMLANVFFHLLPEMAESSLDLHDGFALVLVGLLLSFILEKFIHWHHCHKLDCKHTQPLGTMMIIGDGVHNITDGVLIATAYLVDIKLGIATTIAVILHEIPQEIGDFAVLLHSGFTRKKALMWNFISALTAFIGVIVVLALQSYASGIEMVLLPLVAGNFLYIAGSDLIPSLHKQSDTKTAVWQLASMLAGIALIYTVVSGAHAHDAHEPELKNSNSVIQQQIMPINSDFLDEHDDHDA